jgi:hypothetical protein
VASGTAPAAAVEEAAAVLEDVDETAAVDEANSQRPRSRP